MAMTVRAVAFAMGFPAILISAGCSGKPPLSEVEGTVTWNSAPLPGITVQFIPDADKGTSGPRSTAVTDDEGHFTLVCEDSRPGAVIGHHRVILMDSGDPGGAVRQRDPRQRAAGSNGDSSGRPRNLVNLPDRYKSPVTTPIRREVGPGKQTIELKLP
jgi:hypothetical protein